MSRVGCPVINLDMYVLNFSAIGCLWLESAPLIPYRLSPCWSTCCSSGCQQCLHSRWRVPECSNRSSLKGHEECEIALSWVPQRSHRALCNVNREKELPRRSFFFLTSHFISLCNNRDGKKGEYIFWWIFFRMVYNLMQNTFTEIQNKMLKKKTERT